MADGVEIGVDAAVLQHAGAFGDGEGFGLEVTVGVDAEGGEDIGGVAALAGAGAADVDAFAAEVVEAADAGGVGGDEGDDFGVEAEEEAEGGVGGAFPVAESVVGLVLFVGLGDADGDGAAEDVVDVLDGAAAGGDGDAEGAVGGGFDDLFDGAADGEVDAGLGAGAEGDEGAVAGAAGGEEESGEEEDEFVHGGFLDW